MTTYDNTVKRADHVRPGDVLVAVSADGEHLREVKSVHPGRVTDRVLIVTWDGVVMLRKGDHVRVAHPDTN